MTNCDDNPWDPRCPDNPKPELFVSIRPDQNYWVFSDLDNAIGFLKDSDDNYPGIVHKLQTTIVYFDKQKVC